MQVVTAEGALLERIFDLTYPLWHEGLTRRAYSQWNLGQMRTRWARDRFQRFALVDDRGEVLYRHMPTEVRVVAPEAAAGMQQLMAAVVADGTGRAARLPDRVAAGKTGTSQDGRDAWFVGYAGNWVAGVWLGNDDNRPMKGVGGGGLPARIWHDAMLATPKPKGPPPAPARKPERRPGRRIKRSKPNSPRLWLASRVPSNRARPARTRSCRPARSTRC